MNIQYLVNCRVKFFCQIKQFDLTMICLGEPNVYANPKHCIVTYHLGLRQEEISSGDFEGGRLLFESDSGGGRGWFESDFGDGRSSFESNSGGRRGWLESDFRRGRGW